VTARDRTLLTVLGAIAALAAFWFLALKPKHAAADAAAAQIVTQQGRLQTARQTVAAGLQAKAGHVQDEAAVAELGKALPADDDMASLLYTLDATATGAHVQFDSLVRAGGAAPSPSASPIGATTASAALPPGAVVGSAGLATLPFTFTFKGSYFDLERLLGDVQGFVRASKDSIAVRGRLLTVDGVALTPGANGLSSIEAKVVATAYLSPADVAGATGSVAPGSASSGSSGSTAAPAPSSTAITSSTP
jgi:Tfp pilus assembly protein PilO